MINSGRQLEPSKVVVPVPVWSEKHPKPESRARGLMIAPVPQSTESRAEQKRCRV